MLLENKIKICIIGNSHVASLKEGWENIKKNYPNLTLTFFAEPNKGLENLIVDKKMLIASTESTKKSIEFTSGGKGYIDPLEYDIFLIYGTYASTYRVRRNIFYSYQVEVSAVEDIIFEGLSYEILKKLKKITHKKIYIGNNPLRALNDEISTNNNFETNNEDYLLGIKLMNKYVYKSMGTILLSQPLSTIINGTFITKKIYSTGSAKLNTSNKQIADRKHSGEDTGHMNREYGAIYLKEFFSSIL